MAMGAMPHMWAGQCGIRGEGKSTSAAFNWGRSFRRPVVRAGGGGRKCQLSAASLVLSFQSKPGSSWNRSVVWRRVVRGKM